MVAWGAEAPWSAKKSRGCDPEMSGAIPPRRASTPRRPARTGSNFRRPARAGRCRVEDRALDYRTREPRPEAAFARSREARARAVSASGRRPERRNERRPYRRGRGERRPWEYWRGKRRHEGGAADTLVANRCHARLVVVVAATARCPRRGMSAPGRRLRRRGTRRPYRVQCGAFAHEMVEGTKVLARVAGWISAPPSSARPTEGPCAGVRLTTSRCRGSRTPAPPPPDAGGGAG